MMPITSGAPVRTAGQKPRILVADKNPVVRTGLAELIARDGRFDIVTTVASGGAFIAACTESPVDIGLIGWSLPDMTGGDVPRDARQARHYLEAAAAKDFAPAGRALKKLLGPARTEPLKTASAEADASEREWTP